MFFHLRNAMLFTYSYIIQVVPKIIIAITNFESNRKKYQNTGEQLRYSLL
jgi:hypothetical protein